MLPDVFRDLDRVAAQEFAFLVDQKGSRPPTVEYWRDYFLVYPLSEDLRFRVGMERGTLVPFFSIHSQTERLISFSFPRLLAAMGLSIEECNGLEGAIASEWPLCLKGCAQVLNDHFDAIVDRARSASRESEADGVGVVLPENATIIGAGAYFFHKEILPIERADFWKIIDRDFSPSYLPVTCPLCGGTGNVGVRQLKRNALLAWFRRQPAEFLEIFCPKCDKTSEVTPSRTPSTPSTC